MGIRVVLSYPSVYTFHTRGTRTRASRGLICSPFHLANVEKSLQTDLLRVRTASNARVHSCIYVSVSPHTGDGITVYAMWHDMVSANTTWFSALPSNGFSRDAYLFHAVSFWH